MSIARRMYVSVPGDHVLSPTQQALKWAMIEHVHNQGFVPEIFHSERPYGGSLAAGRGWTFQECAAVMKRCVGALIIGLPRYVIAQDSNTLRLPTEDAHCEGSLAKTCDLPCFLLAEEGIADRGIFHWGGGQLITPFPQGVDSAWISTDRFKNAWRLFRDRIEQRRDIFLGYCGPSEGIASNIKRFIENELQASVLDWRTDFLEGRTIIEEIEDAARRTSGGVFLFTRDDVLAGQTEQGAPRDNVVFEAGFFAQAKGR